MKLKSFNIRETPDGLIMYLNGRERVVDIELTTDQILTFYSLFHNVLWSKFDLVPKNREPAADLLLYGGPAGSGME